MKVAASANMSVASCWEVRVFFSIWNGLLRDETWIKNKKYRTSTSSLIAPAKFHKLIDNNFLIGSEKKGLSDAEYQLKRDGFLNSADCAIILYAYNNKASEEIIIITEETGYNNDGKVFKKIPENCKFIDVKTQTLPEFFKSNDLINLSIDITTTTLF